ncbi:hypothetical protein EG68_11238 [Paragonimus skrjabini miyazakii]|uniref:Uncharacterized protein n=1 Tax=Paragonimus skrjabini miyazakii TaxID=59628 RepID=A0A8S9YEU5_9TREM|nr:hypothetical protein EG68_11238 [Paragonimus skrjabini miyazakii]
MQGGLPARRLGRFRDERVCIIKINEWLLGREKCLIYASLRSFLLDYKTSVINTRLDVRRYLWTISCVQKCLRNEWK